MRLGRSQKSLSIDIEHMKTLHEECIEQLELMKVSLEAAQLSNHLMRDKLDLIAIKHWHAYIDIIHLICLHDNLLEPAIKKIGFDITHHDTFTNQQYETKRLLLTGLLRALLRHHQRIIYIYRVGDEPAKDYLADVALQEKENLASIIEMIHHTL